MSWTHKTLDAHANNPAGPDDYKFNTAGFGKRIILGPDLSIEFIRGWKNHKPINPTMTNPKYSSLVSGDGNLIWY